MELCPLEGGGRSWQWRRLFGCCRNLVPRGRRLCSVRNRYADWVQAQPAAGEGAALFPVGGRRGASLSPAADRGKGAALFSAEGGFNLVSRGRKWGFVRNRYANWMRHHDAANWVQAQPAAVSCRRGRRFAVPRGGRRGASLSPAADRRKRRCAVFRSLGFMVLQQKNLPVGGFSGLCESVVSWELFLLQKVPQAARPFVLRLFPSKGA